MQEFKLQQFAVDASDGLAGTGTKLSYSKDGTSWTDITDVKTIPAVGGTPQTIDVTTLADTRQKQIPGIKQSSSLAFQCVYKGDNFKKAQAICDNNVTYKFKVTYPDGMTAEFEGRATLAMDSLSTNAAVGFTITITVSDGPNFTPATTTVAGA